MSGGGQEQREEATVLHGCKALWGVEGTASEKVLKGKLLLLVGFILVFVSYL